jgi:sigma-B regulation protein RsbU (phosphoserine phosphatase)
LEVAKNIQSSFLPDSVPSIEGWDVAAYYRAARMVGGDFYDFLPLPDGKWGLVVADVADKGVPAALYMALSRTLLRAVARNRDDPAEILLQVNRLLLQDTHSDLFVTMWYGIWDPVDGSLFYSSAGHNPPFVISERATQPLIVKGIALGVLDDIKLHAARAYLKPGDTLVMYTDGITEAHDEQDRQFGLDGLEQATRANCHRPAGDIITAVIEALDNHTGSEPQFDDLTLVIIHHQKEQAAQLAEAAR